MKRLYTYLPLVLLMASCQGEIPFPKNRTHQEQDSVATPLFPYASYIVQGVITHAVTEEPLEEIFLRLSEEDPTSTSALGVYSVHVSAFPVAQTFPLIINSPAIEGYNPLFVTDTLQAHFTYPLRFYLTNQEVRELGSLYYGRAYLTMNHSLRPIDYEQ